MLSVPFNFRALLAIDTILALTLVAVATYIAWQWHADWTLAHQVVTPVAKVPAASDNNTALVGSLASSHLFGKSLTLGALPLSGLQFKVTGIVKADIRDQSKAYISLAGGQGKIFHVGDNLPYGVKVYDITPDAVILENDGHLEKLPLPREKLEFKPRLRG